MDAFTGVTLVVRRRFAHDLTDEARALRGEFLRAAVGIEGFVGADVREGEDAAVYLRFESPEALRRWEHSARRGALLARAAELGWRAPEEVRLEGLATWFVPTSNPVRAPARWRTMVVTAVGMIPTVSALRFALRPVLVELPSWAATILMMAIMMPLMTFVVAPALTKVFGGFLYPESGRAR
jgi:antibiotic biosynthesis monooxygenase (ABM) superfamily enzyme